MQCKSYTCQRLGLGNLFFVLNGQVLIEKKMKQTNFEEFPNHLHHFFSLVYIQVTLQIYKDIEHPLCVVWVNPQLSEHLILFLSIAVRLQSRMAL